MLRFGRCAESPNARAFATTTGEASSVLANLAVEHQGLFGALDNFRGTHSIRLRVDGTGAGDELVFTLDRNAQSGTALST